MHNSWMACGSFHPFLFVFHLLQTQAISHPQLFDFLL
jgi:hypothetical protein